jgi:hypothetical protein
LLGNTFPLPGQVELRRCPACKQLSTTQIKFSRRAPKHQSWSDFRSNR